MNLWSPLRFLITLLVLLAWGVDEVLLLLSVFGMSDYWPFSTVSMTLSSLLPPVSENDDFPAIRKTKPGVENPQDKWNLLWFVPLLFLNSSREFPMEKGER